MGDTRIEYFIGVDAGVNTGLAIWVPAIKELSLHTTDFWGLWDIIESYEPVLYPFMTKVRIETPGRFMYARNKAQKLKREAELKMATNYGGNIREAELIAARFSEKGFTVDRPRPTKNHTKHNAKLFTQITGYPGQTNEHVRDAGMLVYGLHK